MFASVILRGLPPCLLAAFSAGRPREVAAARPRWLPALCKQALHSGSSVASGSVEVMGVLGIDHIAFRTPDPVRLHGFYLELLGAEPLSGAHSPLRAGNTLLVFFAEEAPAGGDELAFGVDGPGFADCLERARRLGAVQREPVEHTAFSRGFLVRDPDGRRIEIVHSDTAVFWQE